MNEYEKGRLEEKEKWLVCLQELGFEEIEDMATRETRLIEKPMKRLQILLKMGYAKKLK